MIIKKIFNREFDEEVHSEFLKFGKGEFSDRYLIKAKKQKSGWIIKAGPEFANYFVKMLLKNFSGNLKISGIIVSTLEMDVPFSNEKKQFMGIKQYKVNSEVNTGEVLDFMKKYPRAFFALSFSLAGNELKIKAKAPKSAKPSTKEKGEAKGDFCSLKVSNFDFIREIFFDFPDFIEISIRHMININEIIYPSNIGSLKAEEVRLQSKRKGVVIREITIDGKKEIREAEFIA